MNFAPTIDSESWLGSRNRAPMQPGAVLLHAPSHVFQAPGGGENQLVQTGRALESLGLSVRPFCSWTDRLDHARLLHLFGMSREGLELARVARRKHRPVILSPICWYEPRSILSLADRPTRAARGLIDFTWKRMMPRWPSWRRELLTLADAILPNSHAEGRQLQTLFGLDPSAIRVVPNGVDPRFAEATPEEFRDWFGPEEFVLYVGRIEPRKNVLGLARACRDLCRHLVVIGDPPPGRRDYLRKCRALGESGMTWKSALPHDSSILASAYAASRVFALPSWFETPGLAALEAALAGRPVVITPYGCTREYFGDRAYYARPDRPRELLHALETAWSAGTDSVFASEIASRYLWSNVARQTAEVYDEAAG